MIRQVNYIVNNIILFVSQQEFICYIQERYFLYELLLRYIDEDWLALDGQIGLIKVIGIILLIYI